VAVDSPGSSGGEPLALFSFSDWQRGELEDVVTGTPLAMKRCRAQKLLRHIERSEVGAMAELRLVGEQTDCNWARPFQA
jgi:hypothetical protein